MKVVSQSASRLRINSAAVTAMPKLANHVLLLVICAPCAYGQSPHFADVARSPSRSSNLVILLPQLVCDSHHPGFERFVRLVRLLLKPWTADHSCLAWQISRFLFRDGINDDAKDSNHPVGILLATPSLAD
jgi:hypothetical protein